MIPTIKTIDLLKLASGDILSLQVYQFKGVQPGKKAYIQANLHGSEIVGNAVIHQLIEIFSTLDENQIRGEIWLVPVCNPLGTNQRSHFFATGRFNSYDGTDWNRIFWDYEKKNNDLESFAKSQINLDLEQIRNNYLQKQKTAFAKHQKAFNKPSSIPYNHYYRYQLQSLCLDANYVIDIHSSSNLAIDYLYCFHTRENSASYFLIEYCVLMNQYDGDAFDEAFMKPWLALEKKLAKLGKKINFDIESWTLELGSGMQMNPESVAKGVRGIQNYLASKGILDLPDFPINNSTAYPITFITRTQMQNYYAPTGGMVQQILPLGAKVKLGQKLYQILSFNRVGKQPIVKDIHAETDGFIFDISINQAVNQGEYVLGVIKL